MKIHFSIFRYKREIWKNVPLFFKDLLLKTYNFVQVFEKKIWLLEYLFK